MTALAGDHIARSPLSLAAILSLGVAGTCSSVMLPFLLESFVKVAHLTDGQAATVAAVEMAAMTAAAASIALSWSRIAANRLILWALIGFAVANLGSTLATDFMSMTFTRCICGLSEGALMSAMNALIAGRPAPERIFALSMALNLSVSAVAFGILPELASVSSPTVFYVAFAMLAAPGMILISWIPSKHVAMTAGGAREFSTASTSMIFALIASLALFTAAGAVWVVDGKIGLGLGLTNERVGLTLSGATLLGIGAGLGASWIGNRVSALTSIVPATIVLSAAMAGFPLFRNPGAFPLLTDLMMGAYIFAAPFYLGTAARLDRTGRVAASAAAVQCAGFSLGPALASLLLNQHAYEVFWMGAGLSMTALLLIVTVHRVPRARAWHDSSRRSQPS